MFVSSINRKKILDSQTLNTVNNILISVIIIVIIQYIITFSFILGRLAVRSLIQ